MSKSQSRSPLAPDAVPDLPAVAGVRLGVASTGTRYKGRPDLMVAAFDAATQVAGVFTRSRAPSAPVDWCRAHLEGGSARALVVNAGNANAFTGRAGARTVREVAKGVAKALGCLTTQVFQASTGVIGEPLDAAPIVKQTKSIAGKLSAEAWEDAARAIMTTDTFPKLATATARIGGKRVTVNGFAKGSGMIAPDMATMLAFVFTDATVPAPVLQELLAASVEKSFNATTVDSDTSTSDTVLAFATGAVANRQASFAGDPVLRGFIKALDAVCLDLAQQVVRDGEGASKFITIDVRGAEDDAAARRIGLAIANSPLVKTAIAGEDSNWGRVVMAIGKSGEAADRDKLAIWIGGIRVASRGAVSPTYREADLVPHMKGREIDIRVHVGVGKGTAKVWTCDLTHGYISINADYRS